MINTERGEHRQYETGSFSYYVDEIEPNKTFRLDLPNRQEGGTSGYLRKFLPFDEVVVYNDNPEPVNVRVSKSRTDGRAHEFTVPRNSEKAVDKLPITDVQLTNLSLDTLTDIRVTVTKEEYDADEEARRERDKGTLEQVVRHITGANL